MKRYIFLLVLIFAANSGCQKDNPSILIEVTGILHLTHNSAIIASDATIITPGMSIFEKGISISETPEPSVNDYSPVGGINIPGAYNTPVSGLKPDTKYYVRAFVHTDLGYYYSEEFTFKTLPAEKFIDPRDGQEYFFVEYLDNTWIVENLNYDIEGSYYFNNDSSGFASEYGRLYSYEAASVACPTGWKLPEDADWKLLETELGMGSFELDLEGPRGSNQASLIKEPGNRLWEGYENNKYSTNQSGFTAKPSGTYNIAQDKFSFDGETGYHTVFWSAANASDVAYVRILYSHQETITRSPAMIKTGAAFSVRCIKVK